MSQRLFGYNGKILRVDLTAGGISEEELSEEKLRRYPGGTCLGVRYLYDEALNAGRRAVNLMRVFNLRRGLGGPLERPSERYGSTPVDGPQAGKSIRPHWDRMLRIYYENMGWDKENGVPLPDTLRNLGLEAVVSAPE